MSMQLSFPLAVVFVFTAHYMALEAFGLDITAARVSVTLPNSTLSTADIQVLIIGSERRDEWRIQSDSWLKHFPYWIATEKHIPRCKLCGTPHATPYKGSLFIGALHHGDRFHGKPLDWYCAQQRPMQALQLMLQHAAGKLPKWLLIVDDDTFVHPRNLVLMLTSHPVEFTRGVAFGNQRRGGAGFLFSQETLRLLSSTVATRGVVWDQDARAYNITGHDATVLEACLASVMGGSWCYLHSDHAMARCIKSAGISLISRKSMRQNCPVGTKIMLPHSDQHVENTLRNASEANNITQAWLRDIMVTCHHMDAQSMSSIYQLARSTWDQV